MEESQIEAILAGNLNQVQDFAGRTERIAELVRYNNGIGAVQFSAKALFHPAKTFHLKKRFDVHLVEADSSHSQPAEGKLQNVLKFRRA